MTNIYTRRLARSLLLGSTMLAASLLGPAAHATSPVYLTPDTSNPTSVTFLGQTFVNQGMVGAGRLASTFVDFRGETLGSFSGMWLDRNSWRKTATGYAGLMWGLPDRGFNSGTIFSDYAARLNAFDLTFTPYTGAANLPAGPGSQNQLALTYNAGLSFAFTDFNGNLTTGNNPGNGISPQGGYSLPTPLAGQLGAGKVSMDSEAVYMLNDGSFYVGDEYTGGVYYFDADGQMAGFLTPPKAILPLTSGGTLTYGVDANLTGTGRRSNQGMEGMSVTPDQKTLFAVLQSGTMQDSVGANQQNRNNTRVLVYDISTNRAPSSPSHEYTLQLPIFDRDGTGPGPDRTAAQSEIFALNSSQFLMLTRDGNGLGVDDGRPLVFKSIYLVDITGATDIAGTPYETGTTSIVDSYSGATGGALAAGITPAQSVELVNIINPGQLNKFGMSTGTTAVHPVVPTNLVSEKWESLGLLPTLEEDKPNDYFLFIGNDNDFATLSGHMSGISNPDGTPSGATTYNSGVINDNMILVYRLTLPTYVDPSYLEAMQLGAPIVLAGIAEGTRSLSTANAIGITSHLNALRSQTQFGEADEDLGWSLWAVGGIGSNGDDSNLQTTPVGATLGLEANLNPAVKLGGALGYQEADADVGGGFRYDYRAWSFSAYGAYSAGGFFANLSYSYGDLDYNDIQRPGAYGLTGVGRSSGTSHNVHFEGGATFDIGGATAGPIVGLDWLSADLDGYTESGASGGNVVYPDRSLDDLGGFAGAELNYPFLNGFVSTLRATYNKAGDGDDDSAVVRLASAQHAMGTQSVTLPDLSQDSVNLSLGLSSGAPGEAFGWFLNYTAAYELDDHAVDHRFLAGVSTKL